MKQIGIAVIALLLTGCATARLSKGPDTFELIRHENRAEVGVAKAQDERKSEGAGTIGGAFVRVKKSDLTELATNYLVQYINSKVELNVVRVAMEGEASVKEIAVSHMVEGIVLLKVKEMKLFSIEALLQPVEADLTLELIVFDSTGDQIYSRTVTGHNETRIGISIVENSTGKIVEAALKDALSQLVKDSELRAIIGKIKYGSIPKVLKILY